jgi:HNH endonuclease/helix-turn-helix protein
VLSLRTGCQSKSGLSRSEFSRVTEGRFLLSCGFPDAHGCIPWIGSKTGKGYGTMRLGKPGSRGTTAHRIAWVLKFGDLAPGVLVLHRCDNPSCVNADHLFLGSAKTNTDDMISKRRHSWRDGAPWQKLNGVDAERVRDLRRAGCTQQEIADWLGVSRPLISMIENGHIAYASRIQE